MSDTGTACGLTAIDRVRMEIILRDSYPDAMPGFEDVEELLNAYDALEAENEKLRKALSDRKCGG